MQTPVGAAVHNLQNQDNSDTQSEDVNWLKAGLAYPNLSCGQKSLGLEFLDSSPSIKMSSCKHGGAIASTEF